MNIDYDIEYKTTTQGKSCLCIVSSEELILR